MGMSIPEYRRLMKLPARPVDQPTKYRSQKIVVDGLRFDSKKEYRYFFMLTALMQARDPAVRVVTIERQVYFQLVPAQRDRAGKLLERAMGYYLDFRITYADGRVEHVDVKSPVTRRLPGYISKRKLMLERHNVHVMEV